MKSVIKVKSKPYMQSEHKHAVKWLIESRELIRRRNSKNLLKRKVQNLMRVTKQLKSLKSKSDHNLKWIKELKMLAGNNNNSNRRFSHIFQRSHSKWLS